MSSITPHIVVEDGVEFHLGVLCGREIHYSFEQVLTYLECKGQRMFGSHFKIFEEDLPTIKKLIHFFIGDKENCQRHGLDPSKGVLLTGPVGCGKTSLMHLMKFVVHYRRPYKLIPCRDLVFKFNQLGHGVITEYGNQDYFCFDDLGVEPTGRHFGQDCNVMGEILISRYELYTKHRLKTHLTSNLNAEEIESRYGNRVRSRMRRLFNLIPFETNSKDKR